MNGKSSQDCSDMKQILNSTYSGSNNKKSLIDLILPQNFNDNLIVFVHGYKGFKDWGAWNLVQQYFTTKGYGFCKFNMTHNGGTIDNGIDFPDLDAFANNSYTKEKYDLHCVINWLEQQFDSLPFLHLMGHSRGGGIVLLNAKDSRVTSVITLAAISSIKKRFSDPDIMSRWKKEGVRYEENTRTGQQMPLLYSQAEDFLSNQEQLDIEVSCRSLSKPGLHIHGTADRSVPIQEGVDIAAWTTHPLHVIDAADHTFGSSHPWNSDQLSPHLTIACTTVSTFLHALQHNPPILSTTKR